MKLGISKETKQTFIGSVAGSLIVAMEQAANDVIPAYPQILKDNIAPHMPRYGQLLADVAPIGAVWAISRKKKSAQLKNMRTGLFLYSIPKLINQFFVGGLEQVPMRAGAPLRLSIVPRSNMPTPIPPAQSFRSPSPSLPAIPMTSGAGKYSASKTTTPQFTSKGIGKYST